MARKSSGWGGGRDAQAERLQDAEYVAFLVDVAPKVREAIAAYAKAHEDWKAPAPRPAEEDGEWVKVTRKVRDKGGRTRTVTQEEFRPAKRQGPSHWALVWDLSKVLDGDVAIEDGEVVSYA